MLITYWLSFNHGSFCPECVLARWLSLWTDCGCFVLDALCKGELKWLKHIQDSDKAHVFSIKGALLIFRLVHLKKLICWPVFFPGLLPWLAPVWKQFIWLLLKWGWHNSDEDFVSTASSGRPSAGDEDSAPQHTGDTGSSVGVLWCQRPQERWGPIPQVKVGQGQEEIIITCCC